MELWDVMYFNNTLKWINEDCGSIKSTVTELYQAAIINSVGNTDC